MAVSLLGASNFANPFVAHQAGDLVLIVMRNNSSVVPVPPAPGGNVPDWTIIESVSSSTFSWVVALTIAKDGLTDAGVWSPSNTWMWSIFRTAAGTIPSIVQPVTVRFDENFTSRFIWPAFTTTKKDGSSLGVLLGQYSQQGGSFSNNATWRPTGFTLRCVNANLVTFASMALHTSTAGLTADWPGFTSGDITPTVFKQRSMAFEVVEASPVVLAGPRMML